MRDDKGKKLPYNQADLQLGRPGRQMKTDDDGDDGGDD